jgi:hypothetical protein
MKKAIGLIIVLLVFAANVEAQMAIQFFVLPVETVGQARGPQYLPWRFDADPENSIVTNRWSCKDNGLSPTMICAVDADQAELDTLAAKPDVFGDIPPDLDTTPSVQELSAFETFIEARAIPGQFNPATPWREILREVLGQFFAAQKYHRITGEAPEDSGVQLNTQLRNMPAYVQSAWAQVANEFGYDWTEIKSTDNARTILKWFQAQWGTQPILFGFVTL